MTSDEYIESRLDEQISWYSTKSSWNKNRYRCFRIVEISCATIIPFLSGMGEHVKYNVWIIGILGILTAITATTVSLFKFHENWTHYRIISEQLKHERFLFVTNTRPYDGDNRFSNLVERVESLISKETLSWNQTNRKTVKLNH